MTLNLSWITSGLAVGGSFPCEAVERLVSEHRIGAVVDLREEACDDAQLLRAHAVELLHLPTEDHGPICPRMLDDGITFVATHLARGRRVLVHCEHGIGRSALLALCVLVDGGLAPLEALELAKTRRALVSPSPAQLAAWSAWLHGRGIAAPPFDELAAIAYRHLRGS
ncbi:MAG: Dual specificity protein phosphatase [Myxococcales bacterium]|nr:Dual specificity protein phosphatase [Myxococcales bacterium]